MVKILIKKLNSKVKLPKYKTDGSSGMDLMAFLSKPISIMPQKSELIPTGLSIAIPDNTEVQIRPRSGLAVKNNISVLNTPGTIDSDYRGELKVILYNHGNKEFVINNDDRIAQMIIVPVVQAKFKIVENFKESERGEKGFGSSGLN